MKRCHCAAENEKLAWLITKSMQVQILAAFLLWFVCLGCQATRGGVLGETGTGSAFLSIEGNARGVLRADPDDSPTGKATVDSLGGYIRFIFSDPPITHQYRFALYRFDSVQTAGTLHWCTVVDSTLTFTISGLGGETTTVWRSHPATLGRIIYADTDYVPTAIAKSALGTVMVGYNTAATGDTLLTKVMTSSWLTPTDFSITATSKPSVYCKYTLTGGPNRKVLYIKKVMGNLHREALKWFAGRDDDNPY